MIRFCVDGEYDPLRKTYTLSMGECGEEVSKGRFLGTCYEGGWSYTDQGLFLGTEEECLEFIHSKEIEG